MNTATAFNALALDTSDAAPLYVQIYDQVRELILSGRLGAGTRLPSSRALASELGVSRTTTVAAYEQLASEGFIEGQRGSGVYVAPELPENLLSATEVTGPVPDDASRRAATAAQAETDVPRPFDAAIPEVRSFPFKDWSRHLARSWRTPSPEMLFAKGGSGASVLREAIARHVRSVRGIACAPEQIVVTSGAVESLSLIARAVLGNGDEVIIEDPCYPHAYEALVRSGLTPVAQAVDDEGLVTEDFHRRAEHARAVFVTPSRQYPLGMTLGISRRLALLDWAEQSKGWIIEDDYDSEYRYRGRPLAAMMSLDGNGRVIYLGSFSKLMFRSLRLGYLIVPPSLVQSVQATLSEHPSQASLVPQDALAAFMSSGAFGQHVRRTRRLYAERYALLHALIGSELDGLLQAPRQDSGLHITAYFTDRLCRCLSDTEAARLALESGITVEPLSVHYRSGDARSGLLLGFAGFEPEQLVPAVETLRQVLTGAAGPHADDVS